MSEAFLLQATRLTPVQRGVRAHFQDGGSIAAVLVVLTVILAVLAAVRYLGRRQAAANRRKSDSEPSLLFRDMVRKLDLSTAQRHMLDAVARDAHLPHPAVILLSESRFDDEVRRWRNRGGGEYPIAAGGPVTDVIRGTREVLFPGSSAGGVP